MRFASRLGQEGATMASRLGAEAETGDARKGKTARSAARVDGAPATSIGQDPALRNILDLQRRVGNRTVSRLLAGDGATVQRAGDGDEVRQEPEGAPVAPKGAATRAGWAKVTGAVAKASAFNNKPGSFNNMSAADKERRSALATTRAASGKNRFTGIPPSGEQQGAVGETTHSAGGAWLANQMGRKEMIGDVEEYIPLNERSRHLEQFLTGAHAFITPQIHKNIHSLNEDPKSNWGGWGADYNFVAPLSKADELVASASAPGASGIFDLEKALGVPRGQWVSQCAPDYAIYRYKVMDPAALNLRIPSGRERNAYGSWWKDNKFVEGEWTPGGKTSGGASEAVIDKISLDKLNTLGRDVLDIVLDSSMAENTRRVLAEQRDAGAASSASPGPGAPAPTGATPTTPAVPTGV